MTNPGWLEGLMPESDHDIDSAHEIDDTASQMNDTDSEQIPVATRTASRTATDSDEDSGSTNVVPFTDLAPVRSAANQPEPVPAYVAALATSATSGTVPPRVPPKAPAPLDLGRRAGIGGSLLVEQVRPVPASGWRRLLYRVSFGSINRGESPAVLRERVIDEQIGAPIRSDHKIAVVSLKGGTGKTTVTVGLGHAFADIRNDRVLAVDANPDAGALADRIARVGGHVDGERIPTVYDLIDNGRGERYSDIRTYTLESETGLQVLASHDDPARSEAFSEANYRDTVRLVQDHYQLILSDCGTGITHPAMSGVLDLADTLITTTRLDVASVQRAVAVLDWLDAHHFGDLVSRSVLVISQFAPGKTPVSEQQIREYFGTRVRSIVTVPYDRHLAEGDAVVWALLQRRTRAAFRELATAVSADFPTSWAYDGSGRLPQ